MTTIKVTKDQDFIKNIEIKGHSGYAVSGKDIVCAAISSSTITTINAIISLDEFAIEVKQGEGYLLISTLKNEDVINKLLNNLVDMLADIASDYPKYVKII